MMMLTLLVLWVAVATAMTFALGHSAGSGYDAERRLDLRAPVRQ